MPATGKGRPAQAQRRGGATAPRLIVVARRGFEALCELTAKRPELFEFRDHVLPS